MLYGICIYFANTCVIPSYGWLFKEMRCGKDKEVFMIAWDDSVTYDDMKKLAKSFDRYEE